MMPELLVILACGAGTFLLRFLPIWRARQQTQARAKPAQRLRVLSQRFFAGIAPAALTALLLVSVWPFFRAGEPARMEAAALALLVIYLCKRWTHNLAGSTLLGAVTYGALMHCLTVV